MTYRYFVNGKDLKSLPIEEQLEIRRVLSERIRQEISGGAYDTEEKPHQLAIGGATK